MDIKEISKKLDIYEPFLMIDKININISEKVAKSKKFLSQESWFFKCHIPNEQIMPASLIVEGMLQTMALLIYECLDHDYEKTFIVDIKSKIISKVKPSDKLLTYQAYLLYSNRGILKGKVEAYTNSQKKAEGSFIYASPKLMTLPKLNINN